MIMKINRLNNCKSAQKSFKTKKRGTKKLYHGHYLQHHMKVNGLNICKSAQKSLKN